jgi:hypothetical protein
VIFLLDLVRSRNLVSDSILNQIVYLYLASNDITGVLSDEVCSLINLEELYIEDTSLGGII